MAGNPSKVEPETQNELGHKKPHQSQPAVPSGVDDPLHDEILANERLKKVKSSIIGEPLGDEAQQGQKFSVFWGLPVLSSDAISSVAYAVEEILLVFIPVLAIASFNPLLGVVAVIIGLAAILAFCYRQTIDTYPEGGGAYSVARDNFGRVPSLVAGGALIVGYVLTVAVSSASGSAAIISAFPQLEFLMIPMTILFILIMTLGNLRGTRDSSIVFGLPTYFFIASMLVMIVVGLFKAAAGTLEVNPATDFMQPAEGLTLFLFLRAFSSGCSALTGVEAVSNSVSNFRAPEQRNAKRTLLLMALIIMVIFGGTSVLASQIQVQPDMTSHVTVLSMIAGSVFGNNVMFFIIQGATAVILFMAANTSFNGLPALMSLMASHDYLPHYFANRGSRLVYSSGIIFIAVFACLLELIFQADVHSLIPLYGIGVFLSFTLAQAGMFKHWLVKKTPGWHHRALINGVGALITATATLVIGITKFTQGAWIALVLIALLTLLMLSIYRHYSQVDKDLKISISQFKKRVHQSGQGNQIILPMKSISRAFLKSLNYAYGLGGQIEVYHVSTDEKEAHKLRQHYQKLKLDIPLVIETTSYRNINEVLLSHVDKAHRELAEGQSLTIVMPHLIARHWWQVLLSDQTALTLEMSLLGRRNVVVILVPFIPHPEKPSEMQKATKRIEELSGHEPEQEPDPEC